jgi:RNA polymerase sigma-70 factor, ECF subfamily
VTTAPPSATAQPDVGALAERHRATIWRYLCVLGCDRATADDLAQETFLVALRREGFAVHDPVAALAFLRITARHLWLQSRRRRTPLAAVEAADAVWTEQVGDGDGEPRLVALRACIAALPERSRALLQATYGEDASRSAAADRLGMKANGIKSALQRLRARLHECIARRLRTEEP